MGAYLAEGCLTDHQVHIANNNATYRAAAAEQLQVWAERSEADFVRHDEGADPGAVAYDALQSATAKGHDVVIVDTAGRLQTARPLMEQLSKIRRVIGKDMVSKVYKVLREKRVRVDQATWNRRYREYTEKIKTGSVLEIAAVLRDLFMLKGDKELSFGERKMLDTARNLLVKELAIAKSNSEEKIMEELKTIFGH